MSANSPQQVDAVAAPAAPSSAVPDSAATAAFPLGRTTWSGLLKLSLVTVPVKAYTALATDAKIHFNQLHAGCGQRIRYEKHCPVHGKMDAGAIVSGYQYAPDQYLILDGAERDQLRPAQDRALSLERFLEPQQVDPALFSGRTLYLVPDGLAAQRSYAVLTQALRQRNTCALARIVLSGQRQLALVRPIQRLLAVHLLYYPAQLRCSASLQAELPEISTSAEEQKLAAMLIDTSSTEPLCWADYRDDTAEQLQALIEARLQGRPVETPAVEETPVLSLLDALKRSVASALKEPGPKTAASVKRKRARKTARRSA